MFGIYRQAFPRRSFSIKASVAEGFFACFFAPQKSMSLRFGNGAKQRPAG